MADAAESPQLDLAPLREWRHLVPAWFRSLIWVDSAASYDAFLSYTWKSDSEVALVIHRVLQQFLCPWYKLRNKTIFRDLSCLPAGSSLETELFERLDRSRHLIVLASPDAARSSGMEMEARHWFSRKRDGKVLIIVTGGEFKKWGKIRDNLLPPAVRANLATEPVLIHLQHRRAEILANPTEPKLRSELVDDLKQIFLRLYPGQTWEELRGVERSQRRRALAFRVFLLVIIVVALVSGWYALQQNQIAVSRRLAAQSEDILTRD